MESVEGAMTRRLEAIQRRREAWEEMRKVSPETTCTEYPYPCEYVLRQGLPIEYRNIVCPCATKAQAELEEQKARQMLRQVFSQARSRFGFLEERPDMTFETYTVRPELRRDDAASVLHAKEVCLRYAQDPSLMPFLTIFGPYGSGKTHLAMSIAQAVDDLTVAWANCPDMLAHLRRTFDRDNDLRYSEEFERIQTARLLVIDDFSAEYHLSRGNGVSWAEEQLYQIINHRHWNRLPTVITTNEDVHKRTGRIGSRIRDIHTGQVIRLDCPDHRLMLPRR